MENKINRIYIQDQYIKTLEIYIILRVIKVLRNKSRVERLGSGYYMGVPPKPPGNPSG